MVYCLLWAVAMCCRCTTSGSCSQHSLCMLFWHVQIWAWLFIPAVTSKPSTTICLKMHKDSCLVFSSSLITVGFISGLSYYSELFTGMVRKTAERQRETGADDDTEGRAFWEMCIQTTGAVSCRYNGGLFSIWSTENKLLKWDFITKYAWIEERKTWLGHFVVFVRSIWVSAWDTEVTVA